MNLGELASYITTKLGQTDQASVDACKLFLNARMAMIWDFAQWRDTLCLVSGTATANSPWFVFPPSVGRVQKVRANGTTTIPVFDQATVFDYDPSLFDGTGTPTVGFVVYPPVVWGPSSDPTMSTVSPDQLFVVQDPSNINITADDEGKMILAEMELTDGSTAVASYPIANGYALFTAPLSIFALRVEKPYTTLGFKALFFNDPVGSNGGTPLLPPAASHFPRRQRIRFLSTPTTATPILAACKREYPGLTSDFDSPAISNCDNALLAFATGDLLERQRQYGKAAQKMQEGQQQLAIMLDVERNQTASESRIIPADIGGWDWDCSFGSGGKNFW